MEPVPYIPVSSVSGTLIVTDFDPPTRQCIALIDSHDYEDQKLPVSFRAPDGANFLVERKSIIHTGGPVTIGVGSMDIRTTLRDFRFLGVNVSAHLLPVAITPATDIAPRFLLVGLNGDVVYDAPSTYSFKLKIGPAEAATVMIHIDGEDISPPTERSLLLVDAEFSFIGGNGRQITFGALNVRVLEEATDLVFATDGLETGGAVFVRPNIQPDRQIEARVLDFAPPAPRPGSRSGRHLVATTRSMSEVVVPAPVSRQSSPHRQPRSVHGDSVIGDALRESVFFRGIGSALRSRLSTRPGSDRADSTPAQNPLHPGDGSEEMGPGEGSRGPTTLGAVFGHGRNSNANATPPPSSPSRFRQTAVTDNDDLEYQGLGVQRPRSGSADNAEAGPSTKRPRRDA